MFPLRNATIVSANSLLLAESQALFLQAGTVLLMSPWESIMVEEKKGEKHYKP